MLPLSHVQWSKVIPWERSRVPSKNYKYWHLYTIFLQKLMVLLLLYTTCDIFLHFHPVCWRLFWWSLDSAVDALYPRLCTNQRPSYFCPQSLCLYWTLCWHLPTHHQPVSCQTASYKKTTNSTASSLLQVHFTCMLLKGSQIGQYNTTCTSI